MLTGMFILRKGFTTGKKLCYLRACMTRACAAQATFYVLRQIKSVRLLVIQPYAKPCKNNGLR